MATAKLADIKQADATATEKSPPHCEVGIFLPLVVGVNFSVRYNFNSGKMFRSRSVESGAEEERKRM